MSDEIRYPDGWEDDDLRAWCAKQNVPLPKWCKPKEKVLGYSYINPKYQSYYTTGANKEINEYFGGKNTTSAFLYAPSSGVTIEDISVAVKEAIKYVPLECPIELKVDVCPSPSSDSIEMTFHCLVSVLLESGSTTVGWAQKVQFSKMDLYCQKPELICDMILTTVKAVAANINDWALKVLSTGQIEGKPIKGIQWNKSEPYTMITHGKAESVQDIGDFIYGFDATVCGVQVVASHYVPKGEFAVLNKQSAPPQYQPISFKKLVAEYNNAGWWDKIWFKKKS